ncbi:MAG TPA: FKBP-type peptidyl-prolyl cis-trans isomerase [Rhodothermales bacterium]|nr:FKBP-type peptidyl-prolyl cis-trans isomerase [Rhodothermales bacterium]
MHWIRVARLFVLPLAVAFLALYAGGCDASHDPEVSIIDLKVGDGDRAEPGMELWVYYTGWLWHVNGTPFDSLQPPSPPTKFTLGDGRYIKGWNMGIQGMQVGGSRLITIPPELGYGNTVIRDQQDTTIVLIPANTTLVFEVELVDAVAPEQ